MADDARTEIKVDQALEVIRLWPDGPPDPIPNMPSEQVFQQVAGHPNGPQTNMLRNVSDPTLTVYRPARANGVGVIVAPGGGWRILAWEHEGVDVATWLAARGYTAFLLKYRLAPTPPDPAKFAEVSARMSGPLSQIRQAKDAPRQIEEILADETTKAGRKVSIADGRRALELVQGRAAEWGVSPERIGMMGFSAGAFLTVDVTLEDGPSPAFIAPIYGGGANGRPIPADAPPLFTALAQDDRLLFRVVEGLYYDWSQADRPSEMHVFNRGGHGFGMVKLGLPVDRWIDLMGDWMADQGFA